MHERFLVVAACTRGHSPLVVPFLSKYLPLVVLCRLRLRPLRPEQANTFVSSLSGFGAFLLCGLAVSAPSLRCEENSVDLDECRAVGIALRDGSWPAVETWIRRHGVDAPITFSGTTALALAAEHGSVHIVKRLLENEADLGLCDNQGWSALMHAARKGHSYVVTALLDARAVAGGPVDIYGNSPLHVAVGFGHVQAARMLLLGQADPNQRTGDIRAPEDYGAVTLHETPLHIACRVKPPHLELRSRDLILLLLRFQANICLQDDRGDTPVHLLTRKGDAESLWKLLPRASADDARAAAHDLRNALGETAADGAAFSDAPASLGFVLKVASWASKVRSYLPYVGFKDAEPEDYCGTEAEGAAWETYQGRLSSSHKLLKFEDGGDGVRSVPQH